MRQISYKNIIINFSYSNITQRGLSIILNAISEQFENLESLSIDLT